MSESPAKSEPRAAQRGLVLVVDDDPVVLEIVRERLETAGFSVETREEALGTSSWIAEKQPDAVLLDVMMPALSGNEIASLLNRRDLVKKTAVILHSSLEPESLDSMLRSTGAIGAIQKTPDARRFVMEFERLIVRFRSSRSSMPPRSGVVG